MVKAAACQLGKGAHHPLAIWLCVLLISLET